jgi:hypothetical protein
MATKNKKGFIRCVDEGFRTVDLHVHRTHEGLLHKFGIDRHSPGVLALPGLVCLWMVAASPAPSLRLAIAVFLSIMVVFLTGLYIKLWSRTVVTDLMAQLVSIAGVSLFIWVEGSRTFQVDALYLHLFVPAADVLIVVLALAAVLATYLFSDLRGTVPPYQGYLRNTELFADYGPDRARTPGAYILSAFTAPFRGPLQLLLLPAVVSLLATPVLLWKTFGIAAAISILAGVFSGVDDRFSAMWTLLQAGFFRGGALLVSALVMVFATLRLDGLSYVTTVLDSAAAPVILFMLAGAYIFSWWFDYWSARLLSQQILTLIGNPELRSWIPYENNISAAATSVPDDGRLLQIHGASRFLAIRPKDPPPDPASAPAPAPDPAPVASIPRRVPVNEELRKINLFQAYSIGDLVSLLAISAAPGGKAKPLPSQIMARVAAYYALLALAIIVIGGSFVMWLRSSGEIAELRSKTTQPSNLELSTLLFNEKHLRERTPVIALAASGGGTRAALYTASVLLGLSRNNAADRIVLGSGISGGGAALAYFAGYRQSLTDPDAGKREYAWARYFCAMKQPFIQDVLEQASEWRILRGGRLGLLLDQSFRTRWQLPGARRTMGNIQDFGLILNSSLVGFLDRPPCETGPLMDVDSRLHKLTSSALAGGRLLLTNLHLAPDLVGEPLEGAAAHRLPVVIDDRETRLETAAALNANFPPVFSNAAVDRDEQTRFWVTDGGAIDNRGMETLLYAIRQCLRQRKGAANLPVLRVLVADASGYSDTFSQDRGLGALTAAGTNLASQLSLELKDEIQAIYTGAGQPGDFSLVYLFMPNELRNSASFGTHWMLQPEIAVKHEGKTVQLSGEETAQVVRCLYIDGCALSGDSEEVLKWERKDMSKWAELLAGIAPESKAPPKEKR